MAHLSYQYYSSPFGEMILGSLDDQLCLCDWRYRKMRQAVDARIRKYFKADFVEEDSAILQTTRQQLQEYFEGIRESFDIPLLLAGSDFQKKVWKELQEVPFGKTESYLSLSRKLGNENAIRAVAAANGANAISIIIPCHRVIGSSGELVGYAGGLSAKKALLKLEKAQVSEQMSLF